MKCVVVNQFDFEKCRQQLHTIAKLKKNIYLLHSELAEIDDTAAHCAELILLRLQELSEQRRLDNRFAELGGRNFANDIQQTINRSSDPRSA